MDDLATVILYAVCAGAIALALRSIWRSLFVRSPAPAFARLRAASPSRSGR